eukprot:Hpha_TRINITY_DN14430_c0_g2::TRINITY_DN14430_c0_g2_i1::g.157493::m.157493
MMGGAKQEHSDGLGKPFLKRKNCGEISTGLNLQGLVQPGAREGECGRAATNRLRCVHLAAEKIVGEGGTAGVGGVVERGDAVAKRRAHLRVSRHSTAVPPRLQPQRDLLLLLRGDRVKVREEHANQHQHRSAHPDDVLEGVTHRIGLNVTVATVFVAAVADIVTVGGGAAGVVLPSNDVEDQSGAGERQTRAHLHEEYEEGIEHRLMPLPGLVLHGIDNIGQHRPREEVNRSQEESGEKAGHHPVPDGGIVEHGDVEQNVKERDPARPADDVGVTLANLLHNLVPHRHTEGGGEYQNDKKVLELVLVRRHRVLAVQQNVTLHCLGRQPDEEVRERQRQEGPGGEGGLHRFHTSGRTLLRLAALFRTVIGARHNTLTNKDKTQDTPKTEDCGHQYGAH